MNPLSSFDVYTKNWKICFIYFATNFFKIMKMNFSAKQKTIV